jgi:hypothetical protein
VHTLYQLNDPPTPAKSLFDHVFGDEAGYLVTFTGRQARLERDDARVNELVQTYQRYFPYPTAAPAGATYLLEEAQRGRDCYFCVHLFREPGNRRSSNAVGTVSSLWLDEDDGRFPDVGPEPTAVVASSAQRRHLYWRLTRSISVQWAVALNRRIAAFSGGDAGKAGLASVLRAPGTLNYKRHPQVDPVTLKITGTGAWEPEVLEQAFPPLPAPEPPPPSRNGGGTPGDYDGPDVELDEYLAWVEVIGEVPDDAGVKFAIVCPWIDEHSGGDRTGTYVGRRNAGGLWFVCWHEHCQHRGWREFRYKVAPPRTIGLTRYVSTPEGEAVIRRG